MKIKWYCRQKMNITQTIGNNIKYAFLSENNEQCFPLVKESEFLTDSIYAKINKIKFCLYGFTYDPQEDPPVCLTKTRLIVRNKADRNFANNFQNAIEYINEFEEKLNWENSNLLYPQNSPRKNPIVVIEGPANWLHAPPLLSLYTMLIRIGMTYNKSGFDVYNRKLVNYCIVPQNRQDREHLKRSIEKIDEIIAKKASMFNSKIEDNYPGNCLHFRMHDMSSIVRFADGEAKQICSSWYEDKIELTHLINEMSFRNRIKFALTCAEDCYTLNNETTLEHSKSCINLVRQYLDASDTGKQNLGQKLLSAHFNAKDVSRSAIGEPYSEALISASMAAGCASRGGSPIDAVEAAKAAATSFSMINSLPGEMDNNKFIIKMEEYTKIAKSYIDTERINRSKEIIKLASNAVERINDHNKIRLSLYCSEDCMPLVPENKKTIANECIGIIKKWFTIGSVSACKSLYEEINLKITKLKTFDDSFCFNSPHSHAILAISNASQALAVMAMASLSPSGKEITDHIVNCLRCAATAHAYGTESYSETFNVKVQEYIEKSKYLF